MTDDEREALAAWLERGTGSDAEKRRQARRVAAQLQTDGERINALKAALADLIGLFDDPTLPGDDHQDEIDRRLRRARETLKEAGNDR